MITVGVDSSETCSGFAVAGPDRDGGTVLHEVRSFKTDSLGPRPTLLARSQRMRSILAAWEAVLDVAEDLTIATMSPPPLVVIEAKDFMASGGGGSAHEHDRSGLWWHLVNAAYARSCDVVPVAPGSLKVFITGNGRASKDEVVAGVQHHLGRTVRNHDEADAVTLAAMGAYAAGRPLGWMPDENLRTLWNTQWPDSFTRPALARAAGRAPTAPAPKEPTT